MKNGLRHNRAGRAAPVAESCQAVLKAEPRSAPDLRQRGLLALQSGQFEASNQLFEEALALNPHDPETLNNLGQSCVAQGELEQALDHYRRLVELCPQSVHAHTNLALTDERMGNLPAAADSYRRALRLAPGSAAAYCQLAIVLRQLDGLPEALRLAEQAVAIDPARAATYNCLGIVLTDMNDLMAASEAFRRSAALEPDSAQTAVDLGYFFVKCGDIPAAADAYRCAVKLDPNLYIAHLRLGTALTQLGDRTGAAGSYERALVLSPRSSEAITYLGLLHLSEGNFARGLLEFELRESARRARRRFPQPQWRGEALDGARIFLHAEQGLGDALQCVRYVPLVAERGGQVVLGVQTRLQRLLEGTEGARQVINAGETPAELTWHCPLFSLPLAFATDLHSVPAAVPYVSPDPKLVDAWRQRLQGNSLRIGLAWGGNPNYPHELWRSIPLEQLAPLTHLEGATFYSLQMGPAAAQIKQLGSGVQLIDLQNEQKDFADTAAIVASLDLVITIDTSVAHLAGAMGKPVWILLNSSPDWRWLIDRENSPWYPTARLFRQSTLGNWQEAMGRVEQELRKELVRHTDCSL